MCEEEEEEEEEENQKITKWRSDVLLDLSNAAEGYIKRHGQYKASPNSQNLLHWKK